MGIGVPEFRYLKPVADKLPELSKAFLTDRNLPEKKNTKNENKCETTVICRNK